MKSSTLSDIINAGILATSRTLVPSALSRPPVEDKPVEVKMPVFNWNWRSLLKPIYCLPLFQSSFQSSQHFYHELVAWYRKE